MANFLGMNRGYKPRMKSRGFGDTVAKTINRYTNIKSKKGCGCKKRQQTLNRMFPYKR